MMPNIVKRLISLIILLALFVALLYAPLNIQIIVIVIVANIAVYEWLQLIKAKPLPFQTYSLLWVSGIIYIAQGAIAATLLLLHTPILLLSVIISVIITDIGAYICGKLIGGKKLAPTISPGKTWAGLIGACCINGVILWGVTFMWPTILAPIYIIALLCVPFVAQGGDLLESAIKRWAGVKDSGALLPGHGGILDRIDGYLTALPFIYYIYLLYEYLSL